MTPTALVTGASGLLGRDVIKAFQRAQWNTVGTALNRTNPPDVVKLDLLSKENIVSVLEESRPDLIVHCAANRSPESCSQDPAAATAVNVESTQTLAKEAKKRDIFLVYISTDYVFSGRRGEAPYKETDKPDPPNVYGRTKYEGEQVVLAETRGEGKVLAVVLRVPLLYGHCGENDPSKSAVQVLVDAVYKAQKIGPNDAKIKVDNYALRFPTCTEDVGRVIVDIAEIYLDQPDSGKHLPRILQFSGQKPYTKWAMVKILGEEILGLSIGNMEPHDPTKDIDSQADAQRPYDSHLDITTLWDLVVDVSNQDFVAWWRRELRAFRH